MGPTSLLRLVFFTGVAIASAAIAVAAAVEGLVAVSVAWGVVSAGGALLAVSIRQRRRRGPPDT